MSLDTEMEATPEAAPESIAPEAPEAIATEPVERESSLRDDIRASVAELSDRAPRLEPDEPEPAEPEKPQEEKPQDAKPEEKPERPDRPPRIDRPPASWKKATAARWNELPADVRTEVARRENEISRTLAETSVARKAMEEFREIVRPYGQFIALEAGDPVRAISGLLQTAYQLRNAPPPERAAIIARLVQGYSVDVSDLDAALAANLGGPEAQLAQQQQAMQAQIQEHQAQLEQRYRQAVFQQMIAAQTEAVSAFMSTKEFGSDEVRGEMADALESAARRGQRMTLEQAYRFVVQRNPATAAVLRQRAEAERARQVHAQTAKAKRAASSVRGSPVVAPKPDSDRTSLREDIEAAMREVAGR
jgi:hypothetical protein